MFCSIPVLSSLGLVVACILTNHVAILFLEIHFVPFFSINSGQIAIKQFVVKSSFAMIYPLKNLSWTFKMFIGNINQSYLGNNWMIVNQPSHETTISNLVQQNSKYYLREVHNHKLYLVAWIKTPQISLLFHKGRCMS